MRVNGNQVWRSPNSTATSDYISQTVDLSAYAGNPSVTIDFLLHATTVVNRMGWYIDDVELCSAPLIPAISVTKTVGTDPAVCATTDTITVATGSQLFYCYTVTNTGSVTLTRHNVEDSALGTILADFPLTLVPSASAFLTVSTPITVTTVNTVTWTAYNGQPTGPEVATATDTATVIVNTPTALRVAIVRDGPLVGRRLAVPLLLVGGLAVLVWLRRRR